MPGWQAASNGCQSQDALQVSDLPVTRVPGSGGWQRGPRKPHRSETPGVPHPAARARAAARPRKEDHSRLPSPTSPSESELAYIIGNLPATTNPKPKIPTTHPQPQVSRPQVIPLSPIQGLPVSQPSCPSQATRLAMLVSIPRRGRRLSLLRLHSDQKPPLFLPGKPRSLATVAAKIEPQGNPAGSLVSVDATSPGLPASDHSFLFYSFLPGGKRVDWTLVTQRQMCSETFPPAGKIHRYAG